MSTPPQKQIPPDRKALYYGGMALTGLGLLLFLLVFFFFLSKNSQMFQLALWAASWWSVHLVIWRFVDIIHFGRHAQWGLYVALVFSLGAAGTFGIVMLQRLSFKSS